MIDRESLANYLDGVADPEVEAQLATDPQALATWIDQRRTDALLQSLVGSKDILRRSIAAAAQGPSLDDLKAEVLREVSWVERFRRLRIIWAMGFALIVLLFTIQFWPRTTGNVASEKTNSSSPHARLNRITGVVELNGQPTAEGRIVNLGDAIQLSQTAEATLLFSDGTRLALDNGAQLKIRSADAKRLLLAAGNLSAHVQKQPNGESFEIETLFARLHVIGTTFSLAAAVQQSRLEVAEGLVRVNHLRQDSAVDVGGGEFAVAEAGRYLIAGVLATKQESTPGETTNVIDHPFTADSPWNQKLGAAHYAEIIAPALDLAGHGAALQPASRGRPIWIGRASDTLTSISSRYTSEAFAEIPLPSNFPRNRGDWITGTLIDARKSTAYELAGARAEGGGIQTMLCTKIDLHGRGVPPEESGNLFSGLAAIGGVIRAGELTKGIHHVLTIATLHEALNRNFNNGQPFIAPARHMPLELKLIERMGQTGNICYGTRLAIPRDVNVAALNLSAPALEIAKTLQDYGAFVSHSYPALPGGGQRNWRQPHLQFFADEPGDRPDWQKLNEEISRLVTKLKVVTP